MEEIKVLEKIKNLNILIIGETIIDEYQYGYTLGKAGKFPIVAFQNEKMETYYGGIQAIHRHLIDFVDKIDVWTDENAIVKKRYVQNGQKLFETYSTKENVFPSKSRNPEDYDLVIVADFGHGFITKEMKEEILGKSNYLALNTQFNAGNMGMNTINKYEYADYICIDENELRLAMSNQYDDIEKIVMERFNPPQIVSITLSKKGTMIYKDEDITHIDALADDVVDTVGAGDAYLAITAPLAYIGTSPITIGKLGNIAGAIACGYQGNKRYITMKKMREYAKRKLN